MGGRKTKLTPEMQERICRILREGNTRRTAAALVGIDEETFRRWMYLGERGREPYRAFYAAVKNAEEEAVQSRIAVIQKAAQDGNWQAAAWWLERKFPAEWGRIDRVQAEITGKDGGPLQVSRVDGLSEAEMRELLRQALESLPALPPDGGGEE